MYTATRKNLMNHSDSFISLCGHLHMKLSERAHILALDFQSKCLISRIYGYINNTVEFRLIVLLFK